MEKEVMVTIRLLEPLREAMRREAKRRGLTLSAWLRLIAQDEIERKKRKRK